MNTVMDQVTTCSTFVRLDQYYAESARRWNEVSMGRDLTTGSDAGSVAGRERQDALNAKRRAFELVSRHALECPICKLVDR